MQHLLTLNPENVSEEEIQNYSIREASRAIVVDENKNIALLNVSKHGYYKLPGGGIEYGESRLEALQRECIEETGCNITILEEIGSIIEYRKIFELKQTSYCYLVGVKGNKAIPSFTQGELDDSFKLEWLSYEKALANLNQNLTTDFEGKEYIVPRDATFLKKAAEYFQK